MYKKNSDRLKEIFLKKSYHKEFVANDAISFDLYEGETLGIIGMNGAGKSTLLKMVAGVINPTSGTIERHGRITALLELGTGFNAQMSGYDNIALNAKLIGMSDAQIQESRDAIIDFSELGEYIYEPIKTYSSGMKMRLAFSIAIFSKPQVLIVDEALSVGDAHFSAKCTRALRQRKKENLSIIYVSHDLNSLKLLCDRLIMLNNGKLVKEGSPQEVINHYNFFISKLNDSKEKITLRNTQQSGSFGTFDIEITGACIEGETGNTQNFSAGERVTITLHILAKKDAANMTVGILIKDKFAQDIFGTNSYHHNKTIDFRAGNRYEVTFTMPLNIGIGKYALTAAVHTNDTHVEECAHWLENALAFSVTASKAEKFIGLCRLEPTIEFKATHG